MRGIPYAEIFRNLAVQPPVRLDRLVLPRRKPELHARAKQAHCDELPQMPHALKIAVG